ncbi:AraC family transcriptional regulator [Cyclobacterium qasimii]|uniref:Transcriptional regulator n=2 Tax=Cyclobacterium qasimii TaxID=1350429 RepID=S7VAH5_9BACT|nr:AraC family transcriptional regulator [Cyclobacterium qasimii]EPR66567.1 transcriptional regulator [Cyclobacterium qasimii M12-11B]GEO23122.1 AraC family transcriptional regulator [Cyclobacterium qasimii]
MKCKEIRLPQDFDKSFIVFREKGQYIPCPWHFHPEYELVLVLKSTGKRMVGDHIGNFQTGDLVLVGPYLPHVWSNDSIYVNGQATEEADALVIQFKEDFLGGEFLNLPEMEPFRNFQKLSRRGMSFYGKAKEQINPLITEMIHMNGIQRLSNLLSIFNILAHTEEYELLASPVYVAQLDPPNTDRVSKVKNYILNNFNRDISLAEVASIANMAVSTFCIFFKDQYRITFVEYLNSIRIGHACKLLMEQNDSILEVAYKSGFNNLANFNRQFKKFKTMTPTQFKKIINETEMAS